MYVVVSQLSKLPGAALSRPPSFLAVGDSRVGGNLRFMFPLFLGLVAPRLSTGQQNLALHMSVADITKDLETLVKTEKCGPILIRLSWHDAGAFSDGNLKGGCPNAAMRFTDAGEGTFGANAGLPDVALGYLKPITDKYVSSGEISNADLWSLAANVAIKVMGGPDVPTRFGRVDAKSSAESVESQVGRLPDGDKGVDHLRDIFHPKGFNDREIVALSGAHSVGAAHADRSGFDGKWTANNLEFDNAYFKDLLEKSYSANSAIAGQFDNKDVGTMMLESDLALLKDPAFKSVVEEYAANQGAFFKDFASAWQKMQELGVAASLRAAL